MKHLAASWEAEIIERDGRCAKAVPSRCGTLEFLSDIVDDSEIQRATCPACIDAWETAPVEVTTADLAEVVWLIRQLAVTTNDGVARQAADLHNRLARPRTAPRLAEKHPITPEQQAVFEAEVARLRALRAPGGVTLPGGASATFGADGILRRDADGAEMGYYADGQLHPAPGGKP